MCQRRQNSLGAETTFGVLIGLILVGIGASKIDARWASTSPDDSPMLRSLTIGLITFLTVVDHPAEHRLARLLEFWGRVAHSGWQDTAGMLPGIGGLAANWMTLMAGINGFFEPNLLAFAGLHVPLGQEAAGYYHTA
jgi:hypothetical protein